MVDVIERAEEVLSIGIERKAAAAIEKIKEGRLGAAEKDVEWIINAAREELALGYAEMKKKPELRKQERQLEELRAKMINDARDVLDKIRKGEGKEAESILRRIKEEAGAAFGGEAATERRAKRKAS
ncbi:hypothetical protein KY361_04635 [Candidatus Woesearchaeota archaeon]|nr:hypothetical protein [Candidatus Woesearchaeota archaeon]